MSNFAMSGRFASALNVAFERSPILHRPVPFCTRHVPRVQNKSKIGTCTHIQRYSWGKYRIQSKRRGIENGELLVGDVAAMFSFCTYKTIIALVLLPSFPGWMAPLHFNPIRFIEYFSFVLTVIGTWVSVGWLLEAYTIDVSSSLQKSIESTCWIWIISMPITAAQLVLTTAVEDQSLVGTVDFATKVPLPSSGRLEPWITAAGILTVMLIWRSFYACYLDIWSFRGIRGFADKEKEQESFASTLKIVIGFVVVGCLVLHGLSSQDLNMNMYK